MSEKSQLEQFGYEESFKRTLTLRDLVIFGMVYMSVSSCLVLFGFMTAISQNHAVLAYLVAFIAMLFTALSYGKMADAFPISGSTYAYTQRGMDPRLGFLAGWCMVLTYLLIPMLMYVIGASYANALIPSIPYWVWIIVFVIPITGVNLIGIEMVAKLNNTITFALFAGVAVLVGLTIHHVYAVDPSMSLFNWKAIYNPETFDVGALAAAEVMCVLSYLGFDAITTMTEEAKLEKGGIRTAILLACGFQTVVYLAVAYIGTLFVPDFTVLDEVTINTAYFDIFLTAGGVWFQTVMTILIIAALVATCLAAQAAVSRLLFGMGRDKLIPPGFFTYLHPKYNTPTYTIIAIGIISLIGSMFISMEQLSIISTFGGLIGFIFVNLSVITHYFIRQKERNVLTNLIFPLIGAAVCVWITISMDSIGLMVGVAWLVIGILYLMIRCAVSPGFKEKLANVTISD